jgi:hypothetical protein
MKKGFLYTLLAAVITLAGVSGSYASAPVLRDLPDVIIGDFEDNIGTDNNYFVFTNAFRFDDYVSDTDSTVSELKWSFDEGDDDADGPPPAPTQWFQINGKNPIHVGSADQATFDNPTPSLHANPLAANDIRLGNEYATFRDIVFTPTTDTTAPWDGPVPDNGAEETRHADGKVVTFYVSDGFNVVSNSIIVSSIDNTTTDQLSSSQGWEEKINNTAFGSGHNWVPLSQLQGTLSDATAGELRATFNNVGGFKMAGWWTRNPAVTFANSLLYSEIGTDNYVRAKFFIYTGGQPTTAQNEVAGLRLRVANRFAYAAYAFIQPHFEDPNLPSGQNNYAAEIGPSEEAARPSLYRVDLDPIDVPDMTGKEIDRGFEAYGPLGSERGFIALTESAIGIYPKTLIADNTPVKQYRANLNDFQGAVVAGGTSSLRVTRGTDGAWGSTIQTGDTSLNGNVVASNSTSTGYTADVTAFDGIDNEIIVVSSQVTNGNAADQGNRSIRTRIAEDQLYKVKFHATSTLSTQNQAAIDFEVRSLSFQYMNLLQIESGRVGGSQQSTVQQVTPGTGNQLPAADKDPADTTGGYYTVLFHSPMSKQIRPETAFTGQPLSARQPVIHNQLDAEGEDTGNGFKRRDVILGFTMRRSNGPDNAGAYTNISGRVTIDKVDIYRYSSSSVLDGSETYGQ